MYRALSAVMISVAFGQRLGVRRPSGRESRSSHVVGAAQVGGLDTLFASLFLLRRHLGAIDALIADDPGKRAALLADGFLQQLQALQERLGAGRAAGYVHVHGEELVDPLNDRVDV